MQRFPMVWSVWIVGGCLCWATACDTTGAKEAADKSKDIAAKVSDDTKKAVDGSKRAIDSGKKMAADAQAKGDELAADAKAVADGAGKLWADVPETGALSETAKGWIADAAKDAADDAADNGGRSIEQLIVSGQQVAPVALDISRSLAGAIETDKKIEPIYQKVEPGHEGKVDHAIGDMPRVEVIEGLTVGFKRLDETSTEKMVKERGYLVMWREEEHLIGFVYRSKRTIDLDKLVAEAPRIIALGRRGVD